MAAVSLHTHMYAPVSQLSYRPTVFILPYCRSDYMTIVYDTRPAFSGYVLSLLILGLSKVNVFKNMHFSSTFQYHLKKKKIETLLETVEFQNVVAKMSNKQNPQFLNRVQ